MKMKQMLLAAGCMLLLCGCTKSNIVQPETEPGETMGPDFNMYTNIEIDEEQLDSEVKDIFLDEADYPMAVDLDFSLHPDEEYVDITIVLKDGTLAEDAVAYVDEVIKGINDEVATQDFSYGESSANTFGGLYQDNEIRLKVYEETDYKNGGEAMCDTVVPKDTYLVLEIE